MRFNHLIRSLVLALMLLCVPAIAAAQLFVSVSFGPPVLPVYEQPFCPGPDYIWTPGYWAWSPEAGYFWVPGTWVLAPEPGLLWTPGYWAFVDADDLYYWHPGYWGPAVGFYGGIDYGFGYTGTGYYGGYWRDRHFYYNTTVTNVSVTNVRYVYSTPVVNHVTVVDRVSFNGRGGVVARPTRDEEVAARQRRMELTPEQTQHERAASSNRELQAAVNQGRPPVAATMKPAQFSGRGVVPAKQVGTPFKAPEQGLMNRRTMTAQPGNEQRTEHGQTVQPGNQQIERGQQPAQPDNQQRIVRGQQTAQPGNQQRIERGQQTAQPDNQRIERGQQTAQPGNQQRIERGQRAQTPRPELERRTPNVEVPRTPAASQPPEMAPRRNAQPSSERVIRPEDRRSPAMTPVAPRPPAAERRAAPPPESMPRMERQAPPPNMQRMERAPMPNNQAHPEAQGQPSKQKGPDKQPPKDEEHPR